MADLSALMESARPFLDESSRQMLADTVADIGDPDQPRWGTWDTWVGQLADALSGSDLQELKRVVRLGYLRVRFHQMNADEPVLGSEEDLDGFAVMTPEQLRDELDRR
jgi:hypothetical protein